MTGYKKKDIERSLEVLHKGGIILYPTDTIWGLGCDATNQLAVQKIYDIKKRADSKNMLILIDNETRLPQYISVIPEVAWELIEAADNPLTIIYPGSKNLAANLLSDDGSVGIRIVRDKFCEELIRRFRKPLVSTSANISGANAPANFDEITPEVKNRVDYIVEWRQEEKKKKTASSIIKLGLGGEFKILRR
ncbi:MAG TPA: L-threonylcarbamoyladenylate synthase [Bacteroidales bacterium]|nr:L-threonylcarbamoyladenylate synthase [Bacteroidales bacterium]